MLVVGGLLKVASCVHGLIADPLRTRIDVVTIPEPLPIRETIELHAQLQKEQNLTIGRLIINRYPGRLLSDAQWKTLSEMPVPQDPAGKWLVEEESYARSVDAVLADLNMIKYPTIKLPEVHGLSFGQMQQEDINLLLEGYR